MAEFIDQADVRRPVEMPRMGERYPIGGLHATWMVPKALSRTTKTSIKLVDISIAGALVEAPLSKNIKVGSRIKWELNGLGGVVEIRNIREVDEMGHFGVSYFSIDHDLSQLINRVVEKVREENALNTAWERRTF